MGSGTASKQVRPRLPLRPGEGRTFGTGWAYYAVSIAVTGVLALAANTSFGGLPVLMSLLSDDDRLPHLLGLRAERPVHRYGVVTLAVLAGGMLIVVNADTARLIPLYAIGVFIGFTISQTCAPAPTWSSAPSPTGSPPGSFLGLIAG